MTVSGFSTASSSIGVTVTVADGSPAAIVTDVGSGP